MVNLKYICLSDLHLGADYSILTHSDPLTPSATLSALGVALRQLVADVSSPTQPQLLLLGDVLDLSQSPFHKTAMGFQRFVEVFFPHEGAPLFSSSVVYIPGNHDHHLWQSANERDYLAQIPPPAQELPRLSAVTPMFVQPQRESALLTTLMCGYEHLNREHASVTVAYPNFGVVSSDGERGIAFHHGHFIESFYRLLSELRWLIEPHLRDPTSVEALERQNAPWIDFFWSAFGSAGRAGKDLDTLYFLLQDNAAANRWLSHLSKRIVHRLLPYLPMSGEAEMQRIAQLATKVVLDLVVERGAELERNSYLSVLSDSSVAGLRWYLEAPLARQIQSERHDTIPKDMTFIFGHTHKPFEDELPLAMYQLPVKLFNTGGWVLDEPMMTPCEGAAVVLIDDALNLVSLRLYNDPVNGVPISVHIPPSGAYPRANNPLRSAVAYALDRGQRLWQEFSNQAAQALRQRYQFLIQHFDVDARNQPRA